MTTVLVVTIVKTMIIMMVNVKSANVKYFTEAFV
jgi:hypothetical protein